MRDLIVRGLFLFTAFSFILFDHSKAFASEGEHGKSSHAGAESAGPIYFKMPPISVSVLEEGIVIKQRSYLFSIELENEADVEKIISYMPKIKSEYLRYLHALGSSSQRGKLDDFEFIRKRFIKITNKVVGDHLVQSVLFKTI